MGNTAVMPDMRTSEVIASQRCAFLKRSSEHQWYDSLLESAGTGMLNPERALLCYHDKVQVHAI